VVIQRFGSALNLNVELDVAEGATMNGRKTISAPGQEPRKSGKAKPILLGALAAIVGAFPAAGLVALIRSSV